MMKRGLISLSLVVVVVVVYVILKGIVQNSIFCVITCLRW